MSFSKIYFYCGENLESRARLLSLIEAVGLLNVEPLCRKYLHQPNPPADLSNTIIFEKDDLFSDLRNRGAWCFHKYNHKHSSSSYIEFGKKFTKKNFKKALFQWGFFRTLIEFKDRNDSFEKSIDITLFRFWNKFFKSNRFDRQLKFIKPVLERIGGSTHDTVVDFVNLFELSTNSEPDFFKNDNDSATFVTQLLTDDYFFLQALSQAPIDYLSKIYPIFVERVEKIMNGSRVSKLIIFSILIGDTDAVKRAKILFCEEFMDWSNDLLVPTSLSRHHGSGNPLFTPISLVLTLLVFPKESNLALENLIPKLQKLWFRDQDGEGVEEEVCRVGAEKKLPGSLRQLWWDLFRPPLIPERSIWTYGPEVFRLDLDRFVEQFLFYLESSVGQDWPLVRAKRSTRYEKTFVSIRYDVDRPISLSLTEQFIQLHQRLAGRGIGSWYFRPELLESHQIIGRLGEAKEEIGSHLSKIVNPPFGKEFNFHGGWDSCYWRGVETANLGVRSGSRAFENLYCLTSIPQRIYLDGKNGPHAIYLLPPMIPLESDTEGKLSKAFETRFEGKFKPILFPEATSDSAHIIIGCHPDIALDRVSNLLKRYHELDIEFGTVSEGVEFFSIPSVININCTELNIPEQHLTCDTVEDIEKLDFLFFTENSWVPVKKISISN